MKCPHCGKDIPDDKIARHLAGKGGSKSRRNLTTEQALEMVRMRELKKSEKRANFTSKNAKPHPRAATKQAKSNKKGATNES